AGGEERGVQLEAWRQTLTPSTASEPAPSPAPGWDVASDGSGGQWLTPSPGPQRAIGAFLLAMCLAFAGGAASVSTQVRAWPLLIGGLALLLPAALCASVAVWLLGGRGSWHPRPGGLGRRRQGFGHVWGPEFAPLSLAVRP